MPSVPRQKIPQRLAVIQADNCTGCEACIAVCPVDCIELRELADGVKGVRAWCEVDLERCIGCELCVHVPRRRDQPQRLLVCPWEAIEMAPTGRIAQAVANIGGPPEYVANHGATQVAVAEGIERSFAERNRARMETLDQGK